MFRGRFEGGFRGDSRQGFGDIRHFSKETFGLTFGTRGMFRRKDRRVCFEGVSKEAFGEMATGLASGTGGTLRRTVRQGFRWKLRKEAFGRASGRFRKTPKRGERSFGDTRHAPKGCLRGVTERVFRTDSRRGFRR